MFTFGSIDLDYEFNSCVTFADGHISSFRKIEHAKAENANGIYVFTMKGTSEELLDGEDPEGWDAIVLQLGKILYPYDLQVTGSGELVGVRNFEEIQRHWFSKRQEIINYYNSYLIEKESDKYALALKTEEKFVGIIKKNMFYRLLFWNENLSNQEVEVRDFPTRARMAIFSYKKGRMEKNAICYESDCVRDEGSDCLLGGQSTLRIHRDLDGLPSEVYFKARVEEQGVGYFIKELSIKRL